jgi:hypothetical protein
MFSVTVRQARSVVPAALGIAVLLALGASPDAHARSRCGNAFSSPDQPGFSILANKVTCAKARRLTRQQIGGGCPGNRSACDVNGFTCKRRDTGDLYRVQCRRGHRSFSWGGGS